MAKLNLFQKLHKIQNEILGLGKDKKSFSYSYVTGDKLLGVIKPLMNTYGIMLKQEIEKVEKEIINYKTKNGEKTEMLYSVWQKFTWIDIETGEKDENSFFASGMTDWEKGLGSALTYAERYFLLKFFHIATDEDDIDNSERKKEEALNEAQVNPITPNQLKQINILIIELGKDMNVKEQKESVYKWLKIDSLKTIGSKRAIEIIEKLKETKKTKEAK